MARFYANENFPLHVVRELRRLGHDVLTSGQANRRIPHDQVLRFATSQKRELLTQNRRDFLRINDSKGVNHCGIVLYTADPDFAGQARRIDQALSVFQEDSRGELIRVNRPAV